MKAKPSSPLPFCRGHPSCPSHACRVSVLTHVHLLLKSQMAVYCIACSASCYFTKFIRNHLNQSTFPKAM